VLKPVKPKSIVGSTKKRTVNEKNEKTPCYLMTRTHFSLESPIDGSTPKFRNSRRLLPLPLGLPPIAIVEPSASHLHKLHEHNTRQLTISKYKYQSVAKSHKWLQGITISDEVLIRVHPERFQLGTLRKVHTRQNGPYKILKRLGLSAYELEILNDLGISPVFRVEDLTYYHSPTRPQRFPVRSLLPLLLRRPATEELV